MVTDPSEGKEGNPDYYWENGLMVFTAHYHRKRGYCCQSGCRHCPYGFVRTKEEEDNPEKKT